MSKAKNVSMILEKYHFRMSSTIPFKSSSNEVIKNTYKISDKLSGIAIGFATLSEVIDRHDLVKEENNSNSYAFQLIQKGGNFHMFLAAAIIEVIELYDRTFSIDEINKIVGRIRDIVENVCKKDTLTEVVENIFVGAAKVGLFVLCPPVGLQLGEKVDAYSEAIGEAEIFELCIKTVYLVLDNGMNHFDLIKMNYDELKNYALKAKNLDLE